MRMSKLLLLVSLVLVSFLGASAQTCDLQFIQGTNDGTNYDVTIQMRASVAFKLGSSNLVFTYNSADLSNPVILTRSTFDGGNYDALGLFATGPIVSLNIVLNTTNSGTTVPTSYINVATIRFTTVHPTGNSNLVWSSTSDPQHSSTLYKDDESTQLSTSALGNLNTNPLPIQLSSFVASVASAGHAGLRWTTLSEINNYGFEVQKAADKSAAFQSISGSFTAGNGTTTVKHDYSYVDNSYATGNVYRLKQLDLDGTGHFSDAVDPLAVTGVAVKVLPTEYSLSQNYPNPFNPSTRITYRLAAPGRVRLSIYALTGSLIAAPVDGVQSAGDHEIRFDGSGLSSGVYFYTLQQGRLAASKKMLLIR